MNSTDDSATARFRGRTPASGYVLDVAVIGDDEARRRVVGHWRDGAELRSLPDGRWLLRYAEPVEVRAELAPGLPVVSVDRSWLAPGVPPDAAGADEVAWLSAGRVCVSRVDDLTLLRPADWLDSADLETSVLGAVQPPEPAAEPIEPPLPVGNPDLRRTAKIRRPSRRAARLATELATAGGHGSGETRGAQGARGTAARPPRWPRVRNRLTRLALRSPVSARLRRRHERYLRGLTEAFRHRRWEDALREAIAFGAGETALLSLRLPARRTGALRPTPVAGQGASSISYGPTVRQHLRDLYRTAAGELERAGRIDEAAFVLADLLNAPGDAVTLLERHGRRTMAAELAEGRALPPDLVVRLWWRAGERVRATDIARRRGAFATGIRLLADVDADGARRLRQAWVRDRQAAGDHLGAVEAAWPDETLRPEVVTDIEQGIALGGQATGRLFAYLAVYRPGADVLATAQRLLAGTDPAGRQARVRFATTLAELDCADPPYDRALTTVALRALVREGGDGLGGGELARTGAALRSRADPLAVADLARPGRPGRPEPGDPPHLTAAEPGLIPIFDAVVLDGGEALVACGDAGTRLLTGDGRVRAQWPVPAHQLVVADHGGAALLVAHREETVDIHRLDLAGRKVRHWATLRTQRILSSYDGGLLTTVDDDGIAVLDVLADRPRAVWRELTDGSKPLLLSRTPTSIAALVLLPGDAELLQTWQWDLPGWTLRHRRPVQLDEGTTARVLADGTVLSVRRPDPLGPALLCRHGGPRPGNTGLTSAKPVLVADGSAYALVSDGSVTVATSDQAEIMYADFPGAAETDIGLRSHAGITTVWDRQGRILAIGSSSTTLVNTRVR